MGEFAFRACVFIGALVGIFTATLLSLGAAVLFQAGLGEVAGLGVAVALWVILVGVILVLAYWFRPKAASTPGSLVPLAAINALAGALALAAGKKSGWKTTLAAAAERVGFAPPEQSTGTHDDITLYFMVFSATLLAICVIAWRMNLPTLTEQLPTGAEPSKETTPTSRPTRWRLLIEALLLPALALIFGLMLEYRAELCTRPLTESGADTAATDLLALRERIALAFIAATTVSGTYYLLLAIYVWIRQFSTTREEYSMFAAPAVVCLALAVVLPGILALDSSMHVGLTPLPALKTLAWTALGVSPPLTADRVAELLLGLVLGIAVYFPLTNRFTKWSGLESIDQYRQEQRREPPSMMKEGFRTWKRLLLQGALSPVYVETRNYEVRPLEGATDPLAWKDRARELIRLKSASYAFGPESEWHDLAKCWLGKNLDTGKRVLLFAVHEDATAESVAKQLAYANEIAAISEPEIGEIVVASIAPISPPRTAKWRGIPVEWRSEAELLDALVDFRDYFYAIKKRTQVDTLPDSDLTIEQVYVDSEATLTDQETKVTLTDYLDQWTRDTRRRHLAVLGEYGQGKSTATLMWVYRRIKTWKPGVELPVLIELRGSSPRDLDPEQLLGAWSVKFNINPRALLRLVVAGRVILIFEGFDEMALVGDADMRLRHFRTLWQFAFPRAKIVFTGRPNFFLDDQELKRALGIGSPIGDRPYCEAIRLVPFGTEQIARALRNHPSDVREQIPMRAATNERFRELVSRPSLLHVVATLWVREKLSDKDPEALSSAFVMDLFVRHSYRRQQQKGDTAATYQLILTPDERAYFMAGIAAYMAAHELPNQIPSHLLIDAVEQFLEVIPTSISTDSAATGEAAPPLKDRVEGSEQKREGVITDVRACGLLVDDPVTPNTFRFAHKSFMEFLFADVLAETILDREAERAASICRATGAHVTHVFKLPVALQFLSEVLASRIKGVQLSRGKPEDWEQEKAQRLFDALVCSWRNPPARVWAIARIAEILSEQATLCTGNTWRGGFYSTRMLLYGLMIVLGGVFSSAMLARSHTWVSIIWTVPLLVPFASFMMLAMLRRRARMMETMHMLRALTSTVKALPGPRTDPLVWFLRANAPAGSDFKINTDLLWMRIACWRAVCLQIGIDEKVMRRVTGTGWLPGLAGLEVRMLGRFDAYMIMRIVDVVQIEVADVLKDSDKIRIVKYLVEQVDQWYCRNPVTPPSFFLDGGHALAAQMVEDTRRKHRANGGVA